MSTEHRHLTELTKGARLILDGKYGVIEEVTATHARVRFHNEVLNLERRGEADELHEVPWPDLIGPNASGVLMDSLTRDRWTSWTSHNQTKTAARLAVVNLLATGCGSGFEGILNFEGEPIEELRSGGRHLKDLRGEIHRRAQFLHRWLSTAPYEWVLQLRADWWANGKKNAPLKQRVPSVRSIERAVEQVEAGGVYALSDQRGGDQYEDNDTGKRRKTTEELISLIVDNRTDAHSKKTDQWYVRAVMKEAEQKGLDILGEDRLRDLVTLKLNQVGRTPSQARTAQEAAERDEFQSNRSWVPGMELAYDETVGDNFVRMIPGGDPIRPHVHAVAETSTGVIVNVDVTGFYRENNIAMVLYDAARPMVVLPDAHSRWLPRIKGMSPTVILGEGAFKPGAIASTYKSDNIRQNHSRFMVGIMKMLGGDISPSRPGRKVDNRHAETAIKALAQFFEEADAYVGTHTANRGRKAGEDGILDFDEYRALIQEFAYFHYNHAPTPAPLYKSSGLSRLQLWDQLIGEYGAPPAIVDPNAYFSFLRVESHVASTKGIQHNKQFYDAKDLRTLPRSVRGPDGVVTYLVDDRQEDCIWVPVPGEGFIEVPNVLRDLTDAPLTKETAKKAKSLAGVLPTSGFHAAKAYARALDQIGELDKPSVKIQRSLADMRAGWFAYGEAKANGADVLSESSVSSPNPPSPATGVPAPQGGIGPFAHPGPDQRAVEDDLDRPIIRRRD